MCIRPYFSRIAEMGELDTEARAEIEGASKLPNPTLMVNSESYSAFSAQPGSVLNNQELSGPVSQTFQTAGKRKKRT